MQQDDRKHRFNKPGDLSPEQRRAAEEMIRNFNRDPNSNRNSQEIARMAAEMLGLQPEDTQPAPQQAKPVPDLSASATLEELHSGTSRRLTMPNGKTIELKIPKGTHDKARITVKMGEETFLVGVRQEPHPNFSRQGNDLHADCYINPDETASKDSEYRVTTLTGGVMLKIPADTPDKTSIRLKGRGMPDPKNPEQRGDLYVKIHVRSDSEVK